MAEAPHTRRSAAHDRLLANFHAYVREALPELLAQRAPGHEAGQWARVAETARALGLDLVADAAGAMASAPAEQRESRRVTAARALRGLGQAALLPPLVLVGDALPPEPLVAEPWLQAKTVAQAAQLAALWGAETVFVPEAELDEAGMALLGAVPGLRVVAMGATRDNAARKRCVALGVAGCHGSPSGRAELATWARESSPGGGPPLVVLAGLAGPEQQALSEVLTAAGQVVVTSPVGELAVALYELAPAAVVLGDVAQAALAVATVAAHVGRDGCLIFCVGGDAVSLAEAGADEVLSRGASPEQVLAALRARLARRPAATRDVLTGVAARGRWLAEVERAAAWARRSHTPLTVALVRVYSLEQRDQKFGPSVSRTIMRLLAASLERNLRREDLVGRVAPETLGAVLIGCQAEEARRRLNSLVADFSQKIEADKRLANVEIGVGAYDSVRGADRLVLGAEDDLYDSRARAR